MSVQACFALRTALDNPPSGGPNDLIRVHDSAKFKTAYEKATFGVYVKWAIALITCSVWVFLNFGAILADTVSGCKGNNSLCTDPETFWTGDFDWTLLPSCDPSISLRASSCTSVYLIMICLPFDICIFFQLSYARDVAIPNWFACENDADAREINHDWRNWIQCVQWRNSLHCLLLH